MRATQFIKGLAEAYQFKGPFPFDVDHMHGGRGINLPKAETKKYFTDKKQWQRAVDDINSSKYDDNSDYIGVTGRSTVEINGREWARWSDAQQKGYIELSSMSEQGMAEGGEGSGRHTPGSWDSTPGKVGRVEKTAQGIRHHADSSRYGGSEPDVDVDRLDKGAVNTMDKALGVKWDRESKKYFSPIKVDEEDKIGNIDADVDEGLGSKLAGLGLAGAMALGSSGAQARVSGDQDPNINRFTGKPVATQQSTDIAPTTAPASQGFSKEYLQRAADPNRTGRYMISVEKAQELLSNMQEGSDNEKIGGRHDADDFDNMVSRLKKLAGAGPMRTVYDPDRRVYRNMPSAQQPAQQPKKAPR